MYQNLARSADKNACESVHLCDWPEADEGAIDHDLLERMALAQQIAALGRSARSTSNIKLRQPLARARVHAGPRAVELGALADLVTDELNVKALEFVEQEGDLVEYEIGLLPNILGPKYGKRFPVLRRAVASISPVETRALARQLQTGLGVTVELDDGGPAVDLDPEEVEVRTHGREGYAVAEDKGVIVAVDVTLSPELVREGLARDLVRRIQALRKEADFQLDDRIITYYDTSGELAAVFDEWAGYIQAETLSVELSPGPVPDQAQRQETAKIGEHMLSLGVKRA
jgi:isoleucyl-tRNA synthetase